MCIFLIKVIIILLRIVTNYSQRIAYNETCNSTEECSDHRYKCQFDEENVLRCLCDRFHAWEDNVGCVQIYNASEIMNMTVTMSTDNIKFLDDQVDFVIKAQIGAGLFVFAMVIVATVTVTIFCIYVHIQDGKLGKSVPNEKKAKCRRQNAEDLQPSTSASFA